VQGATNQRPLRLLVVMPSWVGDAVMATPALRLVRDALRGSLIGALVRPGIEQVLAGSGLVDLVHVERARGIMGPKLVANKVRPMRYDTALLLTNSFSTALITRLAYIPRRIGYDRDGRGMLLTQRIPPRRREGGRGFAPVPQVEYYLEAARAMLGIEESGGTARLELGTTEEEERSADEILRKAGVTGERPIAILNPGGNNPAKRWPADRFAAVGAHLTQKYGMDVLINGSPGEAELVGEIAGRVKKLVGEGEEIGTNGDGGGSTCGDEVGSAGRGGRGGRGGEHGPGARATVAELPGLGVTLGSLKALVRRCAVMVTNDTGPRHIAAALNVPTVALFGPTDPRWTTLPPGTPEVRIVADPTLPDDEVADDHPERCRIDRIEIGRVIDAVERALEMGRRG